MHTPADTAALTAAGIDPESTQPREHAVPCRCGRRTLNLSGGCDRHYEVPVRAKAVAA